MIDISQRMQSGQAMGTLDELPTVRTFPPQAQGDIRYLVIVRASNAETGERVEHPMEFYAHAPLSPETIKAMAIRDAENVDWSKYPGNNITTETPVRSMTATIISASKRV